VHPAAMFTHNVKQAWLTAQGAAEYCGLSVRTIETLAKDKLIVSSTVIRPGKSRGRRLIERASLDAWILKGIRPAGNDAYRAIPQQENPHSAAEEGGAA